MPKAYESVSLFEALSFVTTRARNVTGNTCGEKKIRVTTDGRMRMTSFVYIYSRPCR